MSTELQKVMKQLKKKHDYSLTIVTPWRPSWAPVGLPQISLRFFFFDSLNMSL